MVMSRITMRGTVNNRLVRHLAALVVLLAAVFASPVAADASAVKITYLYDNTAAVADATPAWGFAALVEAYGKRVLFDTGGDAAIFRQNVAALGVDLGQLDALVLSHEHWDHTKGIPVLERREGLPVFYPAGASPVAQFRDMVEAAGMKPVPVTAMTSIVPHITVSDEMKSPVASEVALVVDTDDGLVVLVGCSHPGPDVMLKQIHERTGRPILMVVGGFHLLDSGPEVVNRTLDVFKALGVRYVGPTHCTGNTAIVATRDAFRNTFIEGGVGTVVQAMPFARGTVR
jgi:7,8-dihydropterin-6-yl-methyl-4-(beta-D-ribofuranosyl)aminobenzene 5'-phosphate synthase